MPRYLYDDIANAQAGMARRGGTEGGLAANSVRSIKDLVGLFSRPGDIQSEREALLAGIEARYGRELAEREGITPEEARARILEGVQPVRSPIRRFGETLGVVSPPAGEPYNRRMAELVGQISRYRDEDARKREGVGDMSTFAGLAEKFETPGVMDPAVRDAAKKAGVPLGEGNLVPYTAKNSVELMQAGERNPGGVGDRAATRWEGAMVAMNTPRGGGGERYNFQRDIFNIATDPNAPPERRAWAQRVLAGKGGSKPMKGPDQWLLENDTVGNDFIDRAREQLEQELEWESSGREGAPPERQHLMFIRRMWNQGQAGGQPGTIGMDDVESLQPGEGGRLGVPSEDATGQEILQWLESQDTFDLPMLQAPEAADYSTRTTVPDDEARMPTTRRVAPRFGTPTTTGSMRRY